MSNRVSHFLQAAVVGLSLWTVPCLEAANPVLPVGGADPHAAIFNGRCYIYATGAGATEEGFTAWSSTDLTTWRNEGMILKFADLNWTPKVDKNAWAPGIIERNGKYFFYFSADSRIGVAVSDTPAGPFKDPLGKPLIPYRDDLSTIDPMAFIDDDGQAYLYWGAVPASWLKGKVDKIYNHLFVRKMNPDMVSFIGEEVATVESVGPHIEGSWMLKRNGTYYLMWSAGNWDTGAGEHAYRVEYATAKSPMGPFTRARNNPVLASDFEQKITGPGHHSVINIPGTDDYYIVYHAHEGDKNRRVYIDRLQFEADGTIAKIKPTRAGILPVDLSKLSGKAAVSPTRTMLEYQNPVWDGYLADPQVLKTGGEYYAYGTGPEHKGRQFPVLHSKDFVNWTFLGNALETVSEPIMTAYWAPEVAEKDGKFYLYYAGEYKMRVAVADHPAGPFKDTGKVLFPDEPFSIDGHPYRDPKSGKWYLFFAKDFLDQRVGTALAVAPLSDDMISIAGPVKTVLRAIADWQIYQRNRTMYDKVFDAWHTVEGAFVVYRDNQYYCFYSGGNWQTPGYGVGFAVADQVMGPYRDEANREGATVLKSIPDKLIGPGHNSVVLGPDNQTYFIVYHSWNNERTKRQMCLDPIVWTAQGPRAYNPSRGQKTVSLPFHPKR